MKERTIYALGFFDGVHKGHQTLLSACRQLASFTGCKAGVVTFTSHPDALVLGNAPLLINTPEDRKMLLQQYHMEKILELPFDRSLMEMPWQDFLAQLCQAGAVGFICGEDFRFGKGGAGTAQRLEEYCREQDLFWSVIPEQTLDDIRISSTYIRKLLEQGEMTAATRFLGHPHILSGIVNHGRGLGRTIHIPTANLTIPEGVVCPAYGVYACKAMVDGNEYRAVTNIGMRPTVNGHHLTVEAHLLDYSGDLYGKQLTLEFYDFLRPEQKFDSLEDLQKQIQLDVKKIRVGQ